MVVVFLAFWSMQGQGFTWCLGGNGLEWVSTFPTLRTADHLRLVAGKDRSVLANDTVVSLDVTTLTASELQQELVELRRRVSKLRALLRLALAVLRSSGFTLTHERLPDG